MKRIKPLACYLLAAALTFGSAQGASLPIPDGVYVTKPQFCEDLRRGDLEMIDFEVLNEGASFSYPESSCVVAEVKDVRTNRIKVTGDCDEAGEVWQSSFFLDLIDYDKIAIDGAPYFLCEAGGADVDYGQEWAKYAAQAEEQLCWFVTVRKTYSYWWEGSSEDLADLTPASVLSAGTEIPAYRQGPEEAPLIGPNGIPLVAEFKGYFVPLADLKFVGKCGPSR